MSPLDLTDPDGVMELLARWTEKLAGGNDRTPPLTRVERVGRQQHYLLYYGLKSPHVEFVTPNVYLDKVTPSANHCIYLVIILSDPDLKRWVKKLVYKCRLIIEKVLYMFSLCQMFYVKGYSTLQYTTFLI